MNRRWMLWIATGFGLGRLPWAPGTFGTLPGVALVLLGRGWWRFDGWGPFVLAASAALLAVPVCASAEQMLGHRDDRRIVADEFLTFPIAVLGVPIAHDRGGWWWLVGAFVVVRVLDILKPWPARQLERCPGGWGVVLDDVVASVYACLILNALARWMFPFMNAG